MSENVKYRMLTTPAEAMAAEGQYVERRCKDIGAWEYVTPGRSLLFYEGMFRLGWQFRARVVEDEPTPPTDAEREALETLRLAALQGNDCEEYSDEIATVLALVDRLTPPQPSPVQGDGELPPLPEAIKAFVPLTALQNVAEYLYTAEQMRAYARAALAAAQPGEDSLILDALESWVHQNGGIRIHDGDYDKDCGGVGLRNTGRTIREALRGLIAAAPKQSQEGG